MPTRSNRRERTTRGPSSVVTTQSGGSAGTFTPPSNLTALKADFSLITAESWFFY